MGSLVLKHPSKVIIGNIPGNGTAKDSYNELDVYLVSNRQGTGISYGFAILFHSNFFNKWIIANTTNMMFPALKVTTTGPYNMPGYHYNNIFANCNGYTFYQGFCMYGDFWRDSQKHSAWYRPYNYHTQVGMPMIPAMFGSYSCDYFEGEFTNDLTSIYSFKNLGSGEDYITAQFAWAGYQRSDDAIDLDGAGICGKYVWIDTINNTTATPFYVGSSLWDGSNGWCWERVLLATSSTISNGIISGAKYPLYHDFGDTEALELYGFYCYSDSSKNGYIIGDINSPDGYWWCSASTYYYALIEETSYTFVYVKNENNPDGKNKDSIVVVYKGSTMKNSYSRQDKSKLQIYVAEVPTMISEVM